MKATEAGRVIGIALEPFTEDGPLSDGKIMVFVNPHWYGGQLSENGSLGDGEIQMPESTSPGLVEKFVALVKNVLEQLGLFIENGIAKVKELIAEKITAKKARLDKIEMVDQISGEIYCTWMENGEWVEIKGECQDIIDTGSQSSGEAAPESGLEPPVEEEPVVEESLNEESSTEEPPVEEPASNPPSTETMEGGGASAGEQSAGQ